MRFFMDEGVYIAIHIVIVLISILILILSIVAIASLKNPATLSTGKPKTFRNLSFVLFALELYSFGTDVFFLSLFAPQIKYYPESTMERYGHLLVWALIGLGLSLLGIIFTQIAVFKSARACGKQEAFIAQGGASFAQPQYAQPQYAQPQYAQPQYAQSQTAQTASAQPEMRICPSCGKQTSANARFCRGCGKELM